MTLVVGERGDLGDRTPEREDFASETTMVGVSGGGGGRAGGFGLRGFSCLEGGAGGFASSGFSNSIGSSCTIDSPGTSLVVPSDFAAC